MTIYKLWRQADDTTFETDARDAQCAADNSSHKLGVSATLQEGNMIANDLMRRGELGPRFGKKLDIPVYEMPRSRAERTPTQRKR